MHDIIVLRLKPYGTFPLHRTSSMGGIITLQGRWDAVQNFFGRVFKMMHSSDHLLVKSLRQPHVSKVKDDLG